MNTKQAKYELQNILSGKSSSSHDALIQAVASYLRGGNRAGPMAEEKHKNKKAEENKLLVFARKNDLLYDTIDHEKFISSGAEQKVYIKNDQSVIKLNDAIFYASWEDYFLNLLIHNYFFSDTSYQLLGFYHTAGVFYAVVQQSFVKADSLTELKLVQDFLSENGFQNSRNNDYYHPKLGLILEDLHDENVLTKKETLYFIDTVFYINPDVFWT